LFTQENFFFSLGERQKKLKYIITDSCTVKKRKKEEDFGIHQIKLI